MEGTSNQLLLPGDSKKQRYVFIDLYRSAVILLMLEGHVFRALLSPDLQRTPFFRIHEFIHGLTAPAFLFGAGLTFVISTRRRWIDYHHWDPPLAKRVRRLLFIILLGLTLHLPYLSFRKILIEGNLNEYLQLFQFDVLHCIGIGLLSLHGLIFFFKHEGKFYALVIATILIICFTTPLVWDVDFLKFLPPYFAQMFNGMHGSPFPIFPYVGFLYAGVIVSWEFLVASQFNRVKNFIYSVTLIGMIFIILGFVFDFLPIQIYPTYNYWFTSPNYFLVRLGSLMVIVTGFWYLGQRFKRPKKIWTVLGIESLFVYVLHLIILYGSVINSDKNIQVIFGTNLSLIHTLGIFIVFFILMLFLALLWNNLKENHNNLYRSIQTIGSGVFLYLFFTRDF